MERPPSELLSTTQVCERLGIDRSTLTRWVSAERIAAAHKLPGPRGAYLFDPDEVERVRTELQQPLPEDAPQTFPAPSQATAPRCSKCATGTAAARLEAPLPRTG